MRFNNVRLLIKWKIDTLESLVMLNECVRNIEFIVFEPLRVKFNCRYFSRVDVPFAKLKNLFWPWTCRLKINIRRAMSTLLTALIYGPNYCNECEV